LRLKESKLNFNLILSLPRPRSGPGEGVRGVECLISRGCIWFDPLNPRSLGPFIDEFLYQFFKEWMASFFMSQTASSMASESEG
jgi:hypothetical protein